FSVDLTTKETQCTAWVQLQLKQDRKRTMKKLIFSLLVTTTAVLSTVSAEAAGWELLGQRQVKVRAEKDTILVTAKEGLFSKLKVKVLKRGIHLADMKVFFGNGKFQDVKLRSDIAAGKETRVIDLPGDGRIIRKIEFIYKTKRGAKGRAMVQVYGKQVAKVIVKPEPALPRSKGTWVKLGLRKVDFKGEKDVIPVTAANGTFRRLKLKVHGSKVRFWDLKVFFGNNEVMDIQIRKTIADGGETRAIDFPGGARVIKKVRLVYKSKNPRTGKANIVLLGFQERGLVKTPVVRKPISKKPVVKLAAKWELLGSRVADGSVDRDTIKVGPQTTYKKLKFAIADKGINILDLKVHFANGEVKDVKVRAVIRKGGESRVIDLPGNARTIKKVVFIYKTLGKRRGKAKVQLWGKSS
ncbi:MAG: DUF2541 family protein, partial [Planctomycetota bacterium]|nr:DUF2541 family protein [Planctomycetota bacterium]